MDDQRHGDYIWEKIKFCDFKITRCVKRSVMVECTQRVICLENFMDNSHFTDSQQVLKQLRQQMGMNRREFCETFDIPYRTVTEWERGNRNAPGYVLRFLEYYIRIQKQNDAMPHTKDERIETDRFLIRHFAMEDAKACLDGWGQDSHLGAFIAGYPMTGEQMQSFVNALADNENAWLITEKQSGACIGYVTMDIPYPQLAIGEIGYVIGEKYQRKGYASEALLCLLKVYLKDRKLYMVEAKYNEENVSSARLLHKLGFKKEAVLKGRRMNLQTGERSNLIVCSVTQEEMKERLEKLCGD